MKISRIAFTVVVAMCSQMMLSCSKTAIVVVPQKNAPPGQVKKATGSKSAKAYAPGQQKKRNR